jgi:hypothetical protein
MDGLEKLKLIKQLLPIMNAIVYLQTGQRNESHKGALFRERKTVPLKLSDDFISHLICTFKASPARPRRETNPVWHTLIASTRQGVPNFGMWQIGYKTPYNMTIHL